MLLPSAAGKVRGLLPPLSSIGSARPAVAATVTVESGLEGCLISSSFCHENPAAPRNDTAIPETEYSVGVKSLKAAAPTNVARMSLTLPVTDVAVYEIGKREVQQGRARRKTTTLAYPAASSQWWRETPHRSSDSREMTQRSKTPRTTRSQRAGKLQCTPTLRGGSRQRGTAEAIRRHCT